MRNGNGRHRRPRQAPAIFVTAGVTGAGIAMPLLGAGGAHAADAGTWDRVAQCETGGSWSENAGNGFYGGLQMTQEAWEQFGGRTYAPRPDLASRSQQIAIAEKVLAGQGMDAWSRCGARAGLAGDDSDAEVDPGLIDLDLDLGDALGDPSAGDGGSGSADRERSDSGSGPDSAESGKAGGADAGAADGEEARSGGTSGPEAPASSGRHRGDPAPEEAGDGAVPDGRTSRDHTRGTGGDYTVKAGDSLSAVAAAHDLNGGWTALYEANRDRLGPDPDLIHPGEHLDFDGLR
ncbi:LysM peptidoglycan-binding domain-containing protein [Streptomyces meridianus]|uniref:LysM peptidoglycan-binding domain-containing protein n=1 Tax=Streptomyces meridianus TaxID=2938945 RepID=UPI002557C9AF|nr:transglycosylase family protein [Streptomyces meridianus]